MCYRIDNQIANNDLKIIVIKLFLRVYNGIHEMLHVSVKLNIALYTLTGTLN